MNTNATAPPTSTSIVPSAPSTHTQSHDTTYSRDEHHHLTPTPTSATPRTPDGPQPLIPNLGRQRITDMPRMNKPQGRQPLLYNGSTGGHNKSNGGGNTQQPEWRRESGQQQASSTNYNNDNNNYYQPNAAPRPLMEGVNNNALGRSTYRSGGGEQQARSSRGSYDTSRSER